MADSLPPSFRPKVAQAVRWSVGWRVAQQSGRFLVSVFLARLLSPADYGLFGMVSLVAGVAAIVNGLGLTPSLVQRRELADEHLSTAFWIAMVIGLVLLIVVALIAPLTAAFFQEPDVALLLSVAALEFPLAALTTVQNARLQRALAFKRISQLSAPGAVLGWVVSLFLAYRGAGPWSLVSANLAAAAATAICYWVGDSWRPKLSTSWVRARELLGFGANVSGSRLLGFANSNLDYLIIGRFLGADPLGIYTLAYQLITFPQTQIAGTLTTVMFPAFSLIQHDNEQLRRGYLKSLRLLALVGFPALLGLAVVAPEFVTIVYGQKWSAVAPVVQVLSLLGILYLVGTTVGSIIESKGRPEIEVQWNLAKLLMLGAGFLVAVRWGVLGIAWASVLIVAGGAGWLQGRVNQLIDLNWRAYLGNLARPAVTAGGMSIAVVLARSSALAAGLPPWQILAVCVTTGFFVYGIGLWLLERGTLQEAFVLVWAR